VSNTPAANANDETNGNQTNAVASADTTTDSPQTSAGDNSAPASTSADLSDDAFETDRAQFTGNVQNQELTEISGLAASTRQNNTFWAINDSGNQPKLFAFNHTGQSLGTWTIAAENRDWEDMASAWINGESYLFIADIGDNLRVKDEHVVHVIAEPLLDNTSGTLEPLHTIRFRYPGLSHNAESLAIDGEWLYVLTKEPLIDGERQASRVYRIPLSFSQQNQIADAELIAQLAIPAVSLEAMLIASVGGVDVTQPTAFDIDEQNRTAYVLTYRSVYQYRREQNQSWAEALAQPRNLIHSHSLSQAEALAVSENGVVWFTSENLPAPLWALPGAQL